MKRSSEDRENDEDTKKKADAERDDTFSAPVKLRKCTFEPVRMPAVSNVNDIRNRTMHYQAVKLRQQFLHKNRRIGDLERDLDKLKRRQEMDENQFVKIYNLFSEIEEYICTQTKNEFGKESINRDAPTGTMVAGMSLEQYNHFVMVKRIIVQGLSSYTTETTIRQYFQQFGELYECVVPPSPRYVATDTGPDNEDTEARSSIQYEPVRPDEVLDDEMDIEPYDEQKHGDFDKYMRKVGEGELFIKHPPKCCAGYAYITFINTNGFTNCMRSDVHEIDRVECTVELAKDEVEKKLKIDSKRLFVSFFPLDRLTSRELKYTFGAYGKISDVEFVSDSEGPLHFCIITFIDSKSVDAILTKSIFIRDVRMFTRRAILKESIKMAELRQKEEESAVRIQLPPNHTAYPHRSNDPSAAAGYAPRPINRAPPPETDPLSSYGYGPRKW
uniref:RRM domain-containing protein n=1 Tax=Caenorhabditis japonica TaxID=281687 RepID=A0A8R1DQ96_CAEJA